MFLVQYDISSTSEVPMYYSFPSRHSDGYKNELNHFLDVVQVIATYSLQQFVSQSYIPRTMRRWVWPTGWPPPCPRSRTLVRSPPGPARPSHSLGPRTSCRRESVSKPNYFSNMKLDNMKNLFLYFLFLLWNINFYKTFIWGIQLFNYLQSFDNLQS